jgi:hypothetical protein
MIKNLGALNLGYTKQAAQHTLQATPLRGLVSGLDLVM